MSANPQSRQFTAGIAVMNAGKPLVNETPASILAQLQTTTAPALATKLGITHVALYQWLLRNCPEEWQSHSAAQQLGKIESYQERYDSDEPMDSVTVARIREAAKIAMWQLSKTSKMYADKQEINAGISITVNVNRDLQDNTITIDQDPPVPLPGALSDGGGGK